MDDKTFIKFTKFLNKEYSRFSERVSGIEKKVEQKVDSVYTKMDAVFKELVTIRQEIVMMSGGQKRTSETLEDHEKRIKKLETQRASL